jgi:hypothetical protein
MRTTTVTAGPLAAANAAIVCAAQALAQAGQLILSGSASEVFFGTGSIAGNVLTISAVTSGVLNFGTPLNANGMAPGTTVVGVLAGTTNGVGQYLVQPAQTLASRLINGGAVLALDAPRRLLISSTGADAARVFTLVGTGWNNEPITETITGVVAGAPVQSALDYRTVTSVSADAATAGVISVGTSTVASSRWMFFDPYADAQAFLQVTAFGVVNYTVETTMQSPNLFDAPVPPGTEIWLPSSIATLVAATTTQQGSYPVVPGWIRATLNSGTGSISMTVTQMSAVPA